MKSKRKKFISAYLMSFNATRAAIAAGYSERSAPTTGHDLLRQPKVAEAIKLHLTASAMSADEVLMRLAELARGEVGGRDKVRALELLGKSYAMFVDKQIIQTLGGLEITDDEASGDPAAPPARETG